MTDKVNIVEQMAQRMALLEKTLGEAVAPLLQEFHKDTGVTFEELSLDIRVIRNSSPDSGQSPEFSISFNDYENDLVSVLDKTRREYKRKSAPAGGKK